MQRRKLGSLEVSVVGLGCNQFGRKLDAQDSAAVINAALDAGVTLLDTSDRYGYGDLPFSDYGRSEEFIGKALGKRREDVVLATKFGNPMGDDPRDRGGSRRYVHVAVERSLRRLDTDYLDLYQIHRPDADTPIEETLGALTELVDAGKVREIGCSNYTVEQLIEATEAANQHAVRPFASVQNEYSLLHREPEKDVLPACERLGIGFVPYFPLASGLLTGKYRANEPAPADSRLAQFKPVRPHLDLSEDNMARVERLRAFAESRGHSLLELAFSWLLLRPNVVSVIAGATRPDQVQANVVASQWILTDDEMTEVSSL